jgi:hypothetical protein
MNAIESVFGRRRVLLPVIHVESREQALRNAETAREAGCHGVFLVKHAIEGERLLAIARVPAGPSGTETACPTPDCELVLPLNPLVLSRPVESVER